MSNLHSGDEHNKKVIGIKPIQTVSTPLEQSNTDYEDSVPSEVEQQIKELHLQAKQEIDKAKKQAKEIVDQAKSQIDQEKQDWQQEKQEWIRQASENGFTEGFEAGKQQGFEQYQQMLDQATQLIDLAKTDYQHTIDQSEDLILELGLRAASKILHVQLENNTTMVELVRDVLKEVKEQPLVNVVTNPEDYSIILEYKDELVPIMKGSGELYIYPDSGLTKGDCIVETPYGKIDVSIDSQLNELRNKLFELAQGGNREHSRIS
ncbi:flagellar assembly protein FliH [Aquibacillus sediminis]|uniref:flagellar assembly protein FliH n=1 Tax=Aquibacillus sediminis TaxID=2574734 RepID=UPI001486FAF7|nr:flagellar assembly protein FliH [Aquibacillus sediminis]